MLAQPYAIRSLSMPTSLTGFIHLFAALLALVSGAMIVLGPKGTRTHVRTGRFYLGSMVALNISALSIFRITGDFGSFHAGALLSLATIVVAIGALRFPGRAGVYLHGYCMLWSYLGLGAAAVSEFATHMLGWAPSTGVVGTSLAVFIVGGLVVHTRGAGTIHRVATARQAARS